MIKHLKILFILYKLIIKTYVYNVFYQHFWIRNQNDMGIIYEKNRENSHLYTQK